MIHRLFARRPVPIRIMGGPFRGARLFLNPANSKRKIFGLYEHVLNGWITEHIRNKRWVLDVGANNGYDTYGFAHMMLRNGERNPTVLAFEPEADRLPELTIPKSWPDYRNCRIEIIAKYIGESSDERTTTLNEVFADFAKHLSGNGLVKIDIEGAEVEALSSAGELIGRCEIDWLVEIHGRERIAPVADYFVRAGRPFLLKELIPLRFLKPERRKIETFWLVTV